MLKSNKIKLFGITCFKGAFQPKTFYDSFRITLSAAFPKEPFFSVEVMEAVKWQKCQANSELLIRHAFVPQSFSFIAALSAKGFPALLA